MQFPGNGFWTGPLFSALQGQALSELAKKQCFCIVGNLIFWKSEFEKKHKISKFSVKRWLPWPRRCLVKLVCCLISPDDNSKRVVKTASFIEHLDASGATAYKMPNTRTDQQKLIWWKSVKPEKFIMKSSHSTDLYLLMKSCIAGKLLAISKARCLWGLWQETLFGMRNILCLCLLWSFFNKYFSLSWFNYSSAKYLL